MTKFQEQIMMAMVMLVIVVSFWTVVIVGVVFLLRWHGVNI